jgi:hypothetical protein
MPPSVAHKAVSRHALLSGIGKAQPAKVDALDQGSSKGRQALGRALDYAIRFVGWSSKEAAAHMDVNAADLGKMLAGNRSVQVDRIIAVEALQWPFLRGLARELGHECDETIKRRQPLPLQR